MPVYCNCTCLTTGGSWKNPMKQGLSILLSYHLFVCFRGIDSLDFSEFWHDAGKPFEVLRVFFSFLGKTFFCPKNWGNAPKIEFFEFGEKFQELADLINCFFSFFAC